MKQTNNDTSGGILLLYSHNIEWWLYGSGHSLSETDEEHICAMLAQNFVAGELCTIVPNGDEVYGWWNIKRQ